MLIASRLYLCYRWYSWRDMREGHIMIGTPLARWDFYFLLSIPVADLKGMCWHLRHLQPGLPTLHVSLHTSAILFLSVVGWNVFFSSKNLLCFLGEHLGLWYNLYVISGGNVFKGNFYKQRSGGLTIAFAVSTSHFKIWCASNCMPKTMHGIHSSWGYLSIT